MTSREERDPYGVLGVRRQASADEIARAYRRAARATHPDGGGVGAGAERFRAVSDAYEVLRDPGRRAGYDQRHPLPRPKRAARVGGGSVRYAVPGSQHVVLGSRQPFANVYEVRSHQRLGAVGEMLRVALRLPRADR